MEKIVPWFKTYSVSHTGHVYSLPGPHRRKGKRRMIGGTNSPGGHVFVRFSRGNRTQKNYVHRLVAKLFVGDQPSPQHEVRHLDGNPQNNHVRNIRWGTRLENINDAKRHGTYYSGIEKTSKLDRKKARDIKGLLAVGVPAPEIAQLYGVHPTTICDIKSRGAWATA